MSTKDSKHKKLSEWATELYNKPLCSNAQKFLDTFYGDFLVEKICLNEQFLRFVTIYGTTLAMWSNKHKVFMTPPASELVPSASIMKSMKITTSELIMFGYHDGEFSVSYRNGDKKCYLKPK